MSTLSQALIQKRIESIDILRGIAMIIMALDHVRDFVHVTAGTADPLDLNTTSVFLFLTRFITHFCAPIFVFLSGTSIFLQSQRKTKKELSLFLIKRGFWLIIVEFLIISLAWTFNPAYNFFIFQVIWIIGISMVLLGILIHLPFQILASLGAFILFGHNALDSFEKSQFFSKNLFFDLIHSANFSYYPLFGGKGMIVVYTIIPWVGVMIMGYVAGILFKNEVSPEQRKNKLIRFGSGLITLFIGLRVLNGYGDPIAWSVQDSGLFTFLSFINVNKYPPSLMFLCITIGPSLILLAYLEQFKNAFTDALKTFGRVAFMYYIMHLYLAHIFAVILYFINGHSMAELTSLANNGFLLFTVTGEGFGLIGTYLVWLAVVLILYPVCKKYDALKMTNKHKWWMSYL